MKTKSMVFFIFCFMFPVHTQAVIIDGKFTGLVQYVTDLGVGDPEYSPFWERNIIGEKVSGSFWYDTDLAPGNSAMQPNQAVHATEGNVAKEWVGIEILIGGKQVDISRSIPAGLDILHREEAVVLEDFERPINWDDSDYFAVADVSRATNDKGDYDYKWVTIRIEEPEINIVNGIGLEQEFSWVNIGDRDRVSMGFFNVVGIMGSEKFDAYAFFQLSTLSTSIRTSMPVPEPSSFMLFGFCLLFFFCKGRVWRNKSISKV